MIEAPVRVFAQKRSVQTGNRKSETNEPDSDRCWMAQRLPSNFGWNRKVFLFADVDILEGFLSKAMVTIISNYGKNKFLFQVA